MHPTLKRAGWIILGTILVLIMVGAIYLYSREELWRITDPSGKYTAVVSRRRYQGWKMSLPGDGGSGSGYVEIFGSGGESYGRIPVGMVQLAGDIQWQDMDFSASIPDSGYWIFEKHQCHYRTRGGNYRILIDRWFLIDEFLSYLLWLPLLSIGVACLLAIWRSTRRWIWFVFLTPVVAGLGAALTWVLPLLNGEPDSLNYIKPDRMSLMGASLLAGAALGAFCAIQLCAFEKKLKVWPRWILALGVNVIVLVVYYTPVSVLSYFQMKNVPPYFVGPFDLIWPYLEDTRWNQIELQYFPSIAYGLTLLFWCPALWSVYRLAIYWKRGTVQPLVPFESVAKS